MISMLESVIEFQHFQHIPPRPQDWHSGPLNFAVEFVAVAVGVVGAEGDAGGAAVSVIGADGGGAVGMAFFEEVCGGIDVGTGAEDVGGGELSEGVGGVGGEEAVFDSGGAVADGVVGVCVGGHLGFREFGTDIIGKAVGCQFFIHAGNPPSDGVVGVGESGDDVCGRACAQSVRMKSDKSREKA